MLVWYETMSFKKSKSATYIGYEGTGAKLDLGETGYFSTIPQLQPHKPHNNHIDNGKMHSALNYL